MLPQPRGHGVLFSEDGYFYFGDRDKNIRKVGGENVSASQVEGFVVGLLERGLLADELTFDSAFLEATNF